MFNGFAGWKGPSPQHAASLTRSTSVVLGRRHTAIVLACFSIVAAPLVLGLSYEKHRFTFGDSGKLNYAWFVAGVPDYSGWNGQPLKLTGNGLLADGKSGKLSFSISYLPGKSEVEFKMTRAAKFRARPIFQNLGCVEIKLPAHSASPATSFAVAPPHTS